MIMQKMNLSTANQPEPRLGFQNKVTGKGQNGFRGKKWSWFGNEMVGSIFTTLAVRGMDVRGYRPDRHAC